MTMRTNCFLLVAILLGLIPLNYTHANDSIPKSVILYTPYTKISVSPGASIDYSIDLINNTSGQHCHVDPLCTPSASDAVVFVKSY